MNSKLITRQPKHSTNASRTQRSITPAIKALRRWIIQLLPLLIVLSLWEAGSSPGLNLSFLDRAILGYPSGIIQQLLQLFQNGSIFIHTFVTFQEAIGGLLLAILTGISVGILLAYSKLAATFTLPYVQVLNSIPRIALAPFFIIWFGIGITSKILLAALAAFFPIFFTTYQGLQNIDVELVDAFRVMGANQIQILRMVVLPAVVGWVIAGIRTSLGVALIGAIVAEYIGSRQGLGFLLMAAQGVLNVNRAWAILLVLAAVGVGTDWLIHKLESRLLRWRSTVGESL